MEMNYKSLVDSQIKRYITNIIYCFFLLALLTYIVVTFIGSVFNLIFLLFSVIYICYFYLLFYKLVENVVYLVGLKKYDKTISQTEIDLINKELKGVLTCPDCGYIFTENYIFLLHARFCILKYSDILLIGFRNGFSTVRENRYVNVRVSGYYLCKQIYLVLRNGEKYHFELTKDSYYANKLIDGMIQKNRDVLLGDSKENKKILLERYHIKI